MEKLLFVNACVRGEAHSRTHALCRAFLEEYRALNPEAAVETVALAEMDLRPLDTDMLAKRDEVLAQGRINPGDFELAWQFASANKIVVGAPYWDLSFPSVLKVYVEHISVAGITFRYTDDWLEGICVADHLAYFTTAGGPLAGADYGTDFFRGLCRQFGIPRCSAVSAQRLDMAGAEVTALMARAREEARALAQSF